MTQPKKLCRVLIFDRHLVVREGLHRLLEDEPFAIKGTVELPDKLLQMIARSSFDVLLIEPIIQRGWDLELIEEIFQRKPSVQILIYSAIQRLPLIAEAYEKGVLGFVSKLSDRHTLVKALLQVAEGQKYYSPGIAEQLLNYKQDAANPRRILGKRDLRIFIGLAEHRTWIEIANSLGLSEKTVQNLVPRIQAQLRIKRDDFTATAQKYGLIDAA